MQTPNTKNTALITLDKCKKNHRYTIASIAIPNESLRERFISMGITKGADFTLLYTSLKNLTYSIHINCSQIALRKNEAKLINVVEKLCPNTIKSSHK